MPISPGAKTSTRGVTDLDTGRATRPKESKQVEDPVSNVAEGIKQSPIISVDEHPLPWELYDPDSATSPPETAAYERIVLNFTSPQLGSKYLPAQGNEPSPQSADVSSSQAAQAALSQLQASSASSSISTPIPKSPNSAGSSASILQTTSPQTNSLKSPSIGGSFFSHFRPSSPRVPATPRDDSSRKDKDRIPTVGSERLADVAGQSIPSKETKGMDAKSSRRSTHVRDQFGSVFERFGKKSSHRSESRDRDNARSAGPHSPGALPAFVEGLPLSAPGDSGSSKQHTEITESPVAQLNIPPLLRQTSADSITSTHSVEHEEAGLSRALTKKVFVQVTDDNERFSVVDLLGLASAAGIKERMLSKLHRYEEDQSTFALYETEIGVYNPSGPALTDDQLWNLCTQKGDDRGTLKFLLKQVGPPARPASAVPPPLMSPKTVREALDLRPGTSKTEFDPSMVYTVASNHSKSNSISSLSSLSDLYAGIELAYNNDSGSDVAGKKGATLARSRAVGRRSHASGGSADENRMSIASSSGASRPSSGGLAPLPEQQRVSLDGVILAPSARRRSDAAASASLFKPGMSPSVLQSSDAEAVEELHQTADNPQVRRLFARGSIPQRPATSQAVVHSVMSSTEMDRRTSTASSQPNDDAERTVSPKMRHREISGKQSERQQVSPKTNSGIVPSEATRDPNSAAWMYAPFEEASAAIPSGRQESSEMLRASSEKLAHQVHAMRSTGDMRASGASDRFAPTQNLAAESRRRGSEGRGDPLGLLEAIKQADGRYSGAAVVRGPATGTPNQSQQGSQQAVGQSKAKYNHDITSQSKPSFGHAPAASYSHMPSENSNFAQGDRRFSAAVRPFIQPQPFRNDMAGRQSHPDFGASALHASVREHPATYHGRPANSQVRPMGNHVNEFGARGFQQDPRGHAGSLSAGLPLQQRPHTYHDRPSQPMFRPNFGPLPPRDAPENPYTQAMFPASSSRQVSEFQRNGHGGRLLLSPGMTVQQTMQQQHQGSMTQVSPHFGPREPRTPAGPPPGWDGRSPPLGPARVMMSPNMSSVGPSPQQGPRSMYYGPATQRSTISNARPQPGTVHSMYHAGPATPQSFSSAPLHPTTHPQVQNGHTHSSSQGRPADGHSRQHSHVSYPSNASGSDRSSGSSFSSSTGLHRRDASREDSRPYESPEQPTTAPTSARNSLRGPVSPDRGRQGLADLGSRKTSETTNRMRSASASGDDSATIDISKIRPLPQLPKQPGQTKPASAARISSAGEAENQRHRAREGEGTLRAGQLGGWRSQDSEASQDDTLRADRSTKAQHPRASGPTTMPSSSIESSRRAPAPREADDDDPAANTFASFASFADDDDEGGTWAKPLDAISTQRPKGNQPSSAPIRDGSSSIQPSLRPLTESPTSSRSPSVNARRPELRLTIDSPRAEVATAGPSASSLKPRVSPLSSSRQTSGGLQVDTSLSSGVTRSSSFVAKKDNDWAFRPAPEQLYENLDDFFPKHDLDKPVLDAGLGLTSPLVAGNSPRVAQSPQAGATSPVSATSLSRQKKSIRRIAEDRLRIMEKRHGDMPGRGEGNSDVAKRSVFGKEALQSNPAPQPPATMFKTNAETADGTTSSDEGLDAAHLARRRSTKLWGTRILEMKPGLEHQGQPNVIAGGESPNTEAIAAAKPVFKWVKGDLIGKGTYGRVYIALNATTGEMIAVKQVELPRNESEREDARQRDVVAALKSEIDALKDIDHPNIVSYLGFEETPKYLHLFLEYVPGGSVASVVRKYGPIEETTIKYFVHQILLGLAYLHDNGIIHRDLKGGNILVNLDGQVKISDFGTVRRSEDIYGDFDGTLAGSIAWIAPEVLNKKGYSGKVDIWSLGALTLEMFAGERPWGDSNLMSVMLKVGVEHKAPPIPAWVRLDILAAHFLRLCFTHDPSGRPGARRLLEHRFPDVPPEYKFGESPLYRAMHEANARKKR